MTDAPDDYLADQLGRIVGIEIAVTRLEGKRKLSQNREARDALGAAAGLASSAQQDLADAIRRTRGG